MSEEEILERHEITLHGSLKSVRLPSPALGIGKSFYLYEPRYLEEISHKEVPILYLFRGHQREWVNLYEDDSRKTGTTIELLDQLITSDVLPPLLIVIPGLNSSDNHIPSLGVNMVGQWDKKKSGLGSGRFFDYLCKELFPYSANLYPQTQDGLRLASGFSLGGYTTTLLATQIPGLFHHIALYDATIMWGTKRLPQGIAIPDGVWEKSILFDASLGKPRNPQALKFANATDRILEAEGDYLSKLCKTTWWVGSAAYDGMKGNRERAEYFIEILKEKGIPLGFEEAVIDPVAEHNWYWNDRFLVKFLFGVFHRVNVIQKNAK